MVTKVSGFDEPKIVFCTSADTKPEDVPNGSFCFEMDASGGAVKVYVFDEENISWVPFGS